jgi:2-methylisocitrate lyase-like PEP mutase family enzyme
MNNHPLSSAEKFEQLGQLHHSGKLLVLPNIWDVLGARLLEQLGYPAVATASASVAYTNGFHDGEKMPFEKVRTQLSQIANNVNIPVTADIESAYADNEKDLKYNIRLLLTTGIAGINIEDTNHSDNALYTVAEQSARIRLIKAVSDEMGLPIFINARTDVLLQQDDYQTTDAKLAALVERGIAYKAAGADCFYPIGLREKEIMQTLVQQLQMPVNILALPGVPDLKTMREIGIARVSLGPGFLKIAIQAMKHLAVALQKNEGLDALFSNEVTSDYLRSIIKG